MKILLQHSYVPWTLPPGHMVQSWKTKKVCIRCGGGETGLKEKEWREGRGEQGGVRVDGYAE